MAEGKEKLKRDPSWMMPVRRETMRPHAPGTTPLIRLIDLWNQVQLELEHYLLRLGANADEIRHFANSRDGLQHCVDRCAEVFNAALERDSGDPETEELKKVARRLSDMAAESAQRANGAQAASAQAEAGVSAGAGKEPAKTGTEAAPDLADAEIPGEGKVIGIIRSTGARKAEPPKRGGKAGVPKALRKKRK